MRWHIRRIIRRHKLGVAHEDVSLEFDRVRCGRGTDVDIHLPDLSVALHHAEFSQLANGQVACSALSQAGITFLEANTTYAELAIGAHVRVGRYRISVLSSPDETDVALEIELDSSLTEQGTEAATPAIAPMRANKRGLAFGAAALILAVFMLLPLSMWVDSGWRATLRGLGIGSDSAWNSGPLSNAHSIIGERCEVCHSEVFRRAQNTSCTECHASTATHATTNLDDKRCGSCHRDHNGEASLVQLSDTDCVDCHGEIATHDSDTALPDIHSFASQHPQFTVGVRDAHGKNISRPLDKNKPPLERSGLLFDHGAHLDPTGLKAGNEQRVLACADCHIVTADGSGFKPLEMEVACQSCHRLDFDPNTRRELPHAKIATVMLELREYYASQALAGNYPGYSPTHDATRADLATVPNLPGVVARRRPGQELDEDERRGAQVWAKAMAEYVGRELIRYRACALCHELEPNESGSLPKISAVEVSADWMSGAHFDHAKHDTMACTDCHTAPQSNSSEDVLMPSIETCRDCHAGATQASGLVSVCSDCHRYHRSAQP